MVVIGINNVQVPWLAVHRIIQRANHIISRDIKHSKDTCALLVMALESVSGQFKDKPQRYKRIKMYINTLANILARKTSIDDDNLWTKALVMQVGKTDSDVWTGLGGPQGSRILFGRLLNITTVYDIVQHCDVKCNAGQHNEAQLDRSPPITMQCKKVQESIIQSASHTQYRA